jgi:hypothetical protein
MAVDPIVRYMILCEDCRVDASKGKRIDSFGILSTIISREDPPYPLVHRELCVLLVLTEMRGDGTVEIVCVHEETDETAFHTPAWPVTFGNNPLEIIGLPVRIRGCLFPRPGPYRVQFWYNEQLLAERSLHLR